MSGPIPDGAAIAPWTAMARVALAIAGLLSCFAMTIATVTGSTGVSASTDPTLERFLSKADESLTQYRARRHLEAHNEKFDMHASIDAMTELSSDGRFTFEILAEEGSERIRSKVLRPLLQHEQKFFATGNSSRSSLTTANYDLAAAEIEEPGLVKLLAKPRRRDVALIDGALFVTRADADLVRVEGRLSKNPSFWTTRVDLIRRYDRIGGLRVPVRLDTTAQVRFAGPSTLSMTYEYEMVNGVEIWD